jgi:hypothetical protein
MCATVVACNTRSVKRWLNVGVKGRAAWPTKETTVQFGGRELVLKPATRTTEQSIHIDLRRISDVEALTLINRFLSVLSWCDDQAMENGYGWSGTAAPVAVPLDSRAVGTSIAFPFNRTLEPEQKARLALALFREGRTVNSVPIAFLSYFKILNIFWNDKFVKVAGKRQNPIVEGIREALPKIKDRQALQRLKALADTSTDVPKYLYESGRSAIAHAHADPIVDPDDLSHLRRLSEDIWVIKAIAEHLIGAELKVSRSIIG